MKYCVQTAFRQVCSEKSATLFNSYFFARGAFFESTAFGRTSSRSSISSLSFFQQDKRRNTASNRCAITNLLFGNVWNRFGVHRYGCPVHNSFSHETMLPQSCTKWFFHRSFSIRSKKRKNNRRQFQGDNKPLLNDALAQSISKNLKINRYSNVEVRLVEEKVANERPEVSVVTLAEALEIAKTNKLDLMGVSLNQSPPVLKAANYNRVIYDIAKKEKIAKEKTGKQLQLKEFRFKASIGESDFERKVKNMLEFLAKGHKCQVTIFARLHLVRQNSMIVMQTAQRVIDVAEEFVSQAPKVKPQGVQRAVLMLDPKRQN